MNKQTEKRSRYEIVSVVKGKIKVTFHAEGLSTYYLNKCRYNLKDAKKHLKEIEERGHYDPQYLTIIKVTTIQTIMPVIGY